MYADDFALVATSPEELQAMLSIVATYADRPVKCRQILSLVSAHLSEKVVHWESDEQHHCVYLHHPQNLGEMQGVLSLL